MTELQKQNDKIVQREFKNGMDMRSVRRRMKLDQERLIKRHKPFNDALYNDGQSYCVTCGSNRDNRFNPCIHGFSCCEHLDNDLQCRFNPNCQ